MDSYTEILPVGGLAPLILVVAAVGAGIAAMIGRRRLAIALGVVVVVAALFVGMMNAAPPMTSEGGGPQTGHFIAVPTAPRAEGDGCRLALLAGTLIAHPDWIVAVGDENDAELVFWPHGFHAELTDDGANLRDAGGRLVARTGDRVQAAGGLATFGRREGFAVCATDLHFERFIP